MNNFKDIKESLTVKGVKFVNLANYTTSTGEVQDALINVGVNYRSAQERDLSLLENMPEQTIQHLAKRVGVSEEYVLEAKEKCIASIARSLSKQETPAITGQKEAFEHLNKGIMLHKGTGEVFVKGHLVRKTVRKEGTPSAPKKSKPVTIARKAIEDLLTHKNIRRYSLGKIGKISSKGNTLIIENV